MYIHGFVACMQVLKMDLRALELTYTVCVCCAFAPGKKYVVRSIGVSRFDSDIAVPADFEC